MIFKKIIESEWFPPAILLLLCVILFPVKGVSISPDSSWYLNTALKIYNDFSIDSFIIRRPVFPALMALSFKLFGVSVESGFFIVRFFFVLNAILCYFLGKKLFNKAVGITFSLLVLTSFQVNACSFLLLLDNIIPFFLLLYVLFVYLSFQNGKKRYFALSGVILSVALLTKGVFAFWFVFLPLILFVSKQNRNKTNLKGTILLYIVFTIVLSPWIQRILAGEMPLTTLLGPLADFDKLQNRGFLEWGNKQSTLTFSTIWEKIVSQIHLLKIFYLRYLDSPFVLDKLFCIGFGYSLYQSVWKKSRSHGILIFSVILFSPIIYIAVRAEGISFRHGQMMFLWALLYLMLSAMLFDGCKILGGFVANRSNIERKEKLIKNIMIITTLSICLCLQVFIGVTGNGKKSFFRLMLNKGNTSFSFYQGQFNTSGWASDTVRKASKWIRQNIPVDSKILCQWHYFQAIDFFTEQQYNLIRISTFKSSDLSEKILASHKLGKPLFIAAKYKVEKKRVRGHGFRILFEDAFLKKIKDRNVRYVIVTYRGNHLTLYLNESNVFKLEKSFSDGKIKIYKVRKFHIDEIPSGYPMFNINTYQVLRLLFLSYPNKYQIEKQTLKNILGWEISDLEEFFLTIEKGTEQLFCEKYGCFRKKEIY